MIKLLVESNMSKTLKERELKIKKFICSQLEETVAELVETVPDRSVPLELNELTTKLLTCLEAVFIHRLRDNFIDRVAHVFSGDIERRPEPNLWTLILSISHKHQVLALSEFQYISTDIGRSRAWIRLVLNEGLLSNFVDTIRRDSRLLNQFYEKEAFLRDGEVCLRLRKQLALLAEFYFDLPTNSSLLNKWTASPLGLAGMWISTTAITPEAVVQGCDVAETLTCDTPIRTDAGLENAMFEQIVRCSPSPSVASSLYGESPRRTPVGSFSGFNPNPAEERDNVSLSSACAEIRTEDVRPSSVCSIEVETQTYDSDFVGEHTQTESNWSIENSFENLLVNYKADLGLSSTPVMILDVGLRTNEVKTTNDYDVMEKLEQAATPFETALLSPLSPKAISGFELVQTEEVAPKPNTIVNKILSAIATENGLDSQDYQCTECRRPIGVIFGEARVCHLTGKYYCEDCHENEQLMIPSRVIYNWDFGLYPVSSSSSLLLKQFVTNPVISVMDLNPRLYSYVEDLRLVKDIRSQLFYANAYLETCKSEAKDELRKRLWPKEYLFEHIHLYSLSDLNQVALGSLIPTLKKAVDFSTNHVRSCQLCRVKGFICELCKNPNPIYPFDIGQTHRVEKNISRNSSAIYQAASLDDRKP